MEHKQRSIILRTTDFGEADRLVAFFTEEHGKIKGVAKNAKKSRKRFGGALEPGTIGVARYVERAGAELVRIEDIKVEMPVWKVCGSLACIANLHIALELAEKMLAAASASKERFLLLSRWIDFLSDNEPKIFHRHAFLYKWLSASGIEPVFARCAVCEKKPLTPVKVVPFQGGAVCKNCYKLRFGGVNVSRETLEYLSQFKVGKIMEIRSYSEADEVFNELVAHACGNVLKSLMIAKRLCSADLSS